METACSVGLGICLKFVFSGFKTRNLSSFILYLFFFCRNAVVGIFFLLVVLTLILIFWPRKTLEEELAGSTAKKVSKPLNYNFQPCLKMGLVWFHLIKEIYFVHFPIDRS